MFYNNAQLTQAKISISDLAIITIIGLYPHEKIYPQEILVSFDLYLTRPLDNLENNIKLEIINFFNTHKPLLLEYAVFNLGSQIFNLSQDIISLNLTIKKPQALDNALCSFATIEFLKAHYAT